ncbi:MerR family transcriptional regulator [Gangjinia marincola]|uniref:MerR family transcriptional regulator n=1 Tax=Gangjinia marincola TaxID=578463 RepID=A0ABN1MFZ2_9FLAO
MGEIKQQFSIKDLEAFSGIKAHTIRIWEKRYDILKPKRTDTNIRLYDLESLQKILNIAFLNENGYKISRISKLDNNEISSLVNRISASNSTKSRAIKSFKIAMVNFDHELFLSSFNTLKLTKSFRDIFHEVFLPLLHEIGELWQTNTINPSHEHFITSLIKQKIYTNIEQLQSIKPHRKERNFILYLPNGEIHDIGLLYLHYEILYHGYNAINLGHSLPIEDLKHLASTQENAHFVSFFTVKPDSLEHHLEEIKQELCEPYNAHYWFLGRKVKNLTKSLPDSRMKSFESINEFILYL